MNSAMKMDVKWTSPFHGSEEIRHTSAQIWIRFGDSNATRLDDDWSKSVHEYALLSAYPMALWLAASWWRLRWEPLPTRMKLGVSGEMADPRWRMSHELPAAGYGFVWPPLTFASDGETIRVECRPSAILTKSPVRYLSDFHISVSSQEFEREVDGFLDLVLRRLDPMGETDLHALWREVREERADSAQAALRRLEARLGFDPDEAPGELLDEMLAFGTQVGNEAADEIAPVCAGSDPAKVFEEVQAFAALPGIVGRIALPIRDSVLNRTDPPWQRGKTLAHAVREACGLGGEKLTDEKLGELIQVPKRTMAEWDDVPLRAPMGLAIRGDEDLKLLFRKRNRVGRRFEAARFIADQLCSAAVDKWLPLTDAGTSRQKLQRAFAAEFLCPIESLRSYLGDEFRDEAFEDAAEHFGISEKAVTSHLVNNRLIPRTLADEEVFG
jgi:hypothetical protein